MGNPFPGTLAQSFHFRWWLWAHWTLVLHIPVNVLTKCQYKTNAGSSLTVPRVRCKQLSEATMEPAVEKAGGACGLHVESLTRNESTCACPARSYWAMTSMRKRKSKGCASVPKLFYFFKWIYKVVVNFQVSLKWLAGWSLISSRRYRLWCI